MTDQFTFKYWNENHLNALMALEIATGLAGPRGGPLWNGAWTQLTWLRSYAAEHPGITTTELARAFLRDRAIVYMRNAGDHDDPCYVPCAKGDPGSICFVEAHT